MRVFLVLFAVFILALPTKPVSAGFETDGVDVFIPTSAWLVGPATLLQPADAGFAMPCVMTNQFNNGYTMRFSGGGGRVLAMALDFRQDAFKVGERYDISLSVPPDFEQTVSATAHNSGTILVNLQKQDGFYDALSAGKYLHLTVGAQKLDFALLGVKDGLQRVEACYSPVKQTSEPEIFVRDAKKSAPKPTQASPVYVSQVRPQDETPSDDKILMPMPEGYLKPETNKAPETQQKVPTAGIGGQLAALDNMLENAAQKLAALEPAAGFGEVAGAVEPPPRVEPKTSIPAAPIGKPLANTWLSPLVKQQQGMKQRDIMVVSQPQQQIQQQVQPQIQQQVRQQESPAAVGREKRWRAIKGTNLREVLDVWTKNDNVRLLWKTQREFSIADSVSMQGTFEDALLGLLGQYQGDKKRPLGRIYVDPVLNQRVLVIRTEGES